MGFQPSNPQPVVSASSSHAFDQALRGSADSIGATGNLNRGATTLSDLCNSTFGRRRAKRKRGDAAKAVADATAIKARTKDHAAPKLHPETGSEPPK